MQHAHWFNPPRFRFVILSTFLLGCGGIRADEPAGKIDAVHEVRGILTEHCFRCHSGNSKKGGFSFDGLLQSKEKHPFNEQWYKVFKKLQAGLMPPPEQSSLEPAERAKVEHWIKYGAFAIDPKRPYPGHVTVRRLNQVEYRNTIRDLLGVDYDTSANFPADDTGHGFDNLGDVLSLSPLLLEKYVDAAKVIISSAVPTVSRIPRSSSIPGNRFHVESASNEKSQINPTRRREANMPSSRPVLELSYYQDQSAKLNFNIEHPGTYKLRLNMTANETYVDNQFDENRCEFTFKLKEEVLLKREFGRQGGAQLAFEFDRQLPLGNHEATVTIKPLTTKPQIRRLRIEVKSLDLVGPLSSEYFVKPPGYEQFFPRDVSASPQDRREYARQLLGAFASKAFRRPVEDQSLDRLVSLAESAYQKGQGTFEAGIAKSMIAVLASPRFLFREEMPSQQDNDTYPLIDEYSLASRLSYFLWSSTPDEELLQLAAQGKLRAHLDAQVQRMLKDKRGMAFAENFVGQWLRSRAVETIPIHSPTVLSREPKQVLPDQDVRHKRFFELFRKGTTRSPSEQTEYTKARQTYQRSFNGSPLFMLTDELRRAMRLETEMVFRYILGQDRSLIELINADYTFLNEALWGHYQIDGIEPIRGPEMRLVRLPSGSERGGVLTQGTMLVVTSNPDRTSPVKRGLFILENLLGAPPAAPPPNIPALEDVKPEPGKTLSLRDTLAVHRASPLCASCHNQMDPLGLALENFNALGAYRTEELGQRIEASGELNTGEKFDTIRDLKLILASKRRIDFYRCLTEKLMTYALGRAVEHFDAHTVDEIVERLEANGGKASILIHGVIHSPAFQRMARDNARDTKGGKTK